MARTKHLLRVQQQQNVKKTKKKRAATSSFYRSKLSKLLGTADNSTTASKLVEMKTTKEPTTTDEVRRSQRRPSFTDKTAVTPDQLKRSKRMSVRRRTRVYPRSLVADDITTPISPQKAAEVAEELILRLDDSDITSPETAFRGKNAEVTPMKKQNLNSSMSGDEVHLPVEGYSLGKLQIAEVASASADTSSSSVVKDEPDDDFIIDMHMSEMDTFVETELKLLTAGRQKAKSGKTSKGTATARKAVRKPAPLRMSALEAASLRQKYQTERVSERVSDVVGDVEPVTSTVFPSPSLLIHPPCDTCGGMVRLEKTASTWRFRCKNKHDRCRRYHSNVRKYCQQNPELKRLSEACSVSVLAEMFNTGRYPSELPVYVPEVKQTETNQSPKDTTSEINQSQPMDTTSISSAGGGRIRRPVVRHTPPLPTDSGDIDVSAAALTLGTAKARKSTMPVKSPKEKAKSDKVAKEPRKQKPKEKAGVCCVCGSDVIYLRNRKPTTLIRCSNSECSASRVTLVRKENPHCSILTAADIAKATAPPSVKSSLPLVRTSPADDGRILHAIGVSRATARKSVSAPRTAVAPAVVDGEPKAVARPTAVKPLGVLVKERKMRLLQQQRLLTEMATDSGESANAVVDSSPSAADASSPTASLLPVTGSAVSPKDGLSPSRLVISSDAANNLEADCDKPGVDFGTLNECGGNFDATTGLYMVSCPAQYRKVILFVEDK